MYAINPQVYAEEQDDNYLEAIYVQGYNDCLAGIYSKGYWGGTDEFDAYENGWVAAERGEEI